MLAIVYNFPRRQWEGRFRQFPQVYEKA
jgi:hypothetical protein